MDILLVNPTAGNGRAKRIAPEAEELIKRHGIAVETIFAADSEHAQTIARDAAQSGVDTVFVLGGDGTVISVARGVFQSRTALALLPAGTGNDYRRSLNIPDNWKDALNHALSHEPIRVDAGLINGRPFVNECGVGFDTEVLEYTLFSKRIISGPPAYLYGVIRAMINNNHIGVDIIREDAQPVTKRITVLAIANGGWIGGGIPIAPMANARDGLFDVVTIPAMNRRKMISALQKLLRGDIMSIPGTESFRCSEISIRGDNLKINVDGEIIKENFATFKIAPNALLVRA